MSVPPSSEPGAGGQKARHVHVDQAQGTLVGDYASQINNILHFHYSDAPNAPLGKRAADEVADRVMKLQRDDAVDVLAALPPEVSAAVLEVLWYREKQDLLVSLLTGIRTDIARGVARLLADLIGTDGEWLRLVPDAVVAIRRRADRAGRELGDVEYPFYHAGPSQLGTHGFCQRHEGGRVYWTSRGGAQVVSGKVADVYDSLGESGGGLGFPLTAESQAPLGGRLQRFEGNWQYGKEACDRAGLPFGGTVYWSGQPESGAHGTWGVIGERYELSGGPGGDLGYPLASEEGMRHDKTGTRGARQRFAGGTIYCNYNGGTFVVPPHVSMYRDAHGGDQDWMGFPVSEYLRADPSPERGTRGWYQRFQWDKPYAADILTYRPETNGTFGGTVYVSRARGIWSVSKAIGTYYERAGGTAGWLGFPRSGEIDGRTSPDQPWRCYQYFEGGMVFWSNEHTAVAVSAPVMQLFERSPDLVELLGFPVEAPKSYSEGDGQPQQDGSGQLQFFEHGLVTIRDGSAESYIRAMPPPAADARSISLNALEFGPETVTQGQDITLEYAIQTASGLPFRVVLGASLVSETREEYFDKASDLEVYLVSGEFRYHRLLRVPAAAPAGRYRLVGAVWYPALRGQRLAKLDRGSVVNVVTKVSE